MSQGHIQTPAASPNAPEILSEFDFHLLVDASSSMNDPVKPGSSVTRWAAMQEDLRDFVRASCSVDTNGIGLTIFGGSNIDSADGLGADAVFTKLNSRNVRGSTPTAEALTAAFKTTPAGTKKRFFVIYTDGVPDDDAALRNFIVNQARAQVNDDDCTILFRQIGQGFDDTNRATVYLKNLDDNLGTLTGGRDIVDVVTSDEADNFPNALAMVLKAIND